MLAASVMVSPTRRRATNLSALATVARSVAVVAIILISTITAIDVRADDGSASEPHKQLEADKAEPPGEQAGSTLHPSAPTVVAAPKQVQKRPKVVTIETPADDSAASGLNMATDSDHTDGDHSTADYAAPQNQPVTVTPSDTPSTAAIADPPHVEKPAEAPKPRNSRGSAAASVMFKGFTDLPPLAALAIDPATFKGIQPGTSTVDDLTKNWGAGAANHHADQRVYKLDPYPRVVATIANHRVVAISVELDKPMDAEALAKVLHAENVERVEVFDDEGRSLGEALPERGMLLRTDAASGQVTHLLLEPLDAEPFVSRAMADADTNVRRSLQDLDYAIQLDPKNDKALYVRAELLAQMGRYEDAERSVAAALDLSPDNPAYRLTDAAIENHLERPAEAKVLVKRVLDDAAVPPVVRAQAYCQWGDLLASGPAADYAAAIEAHTRAIKLAQPLANDGQIVIRRQAKRTMVDAHLGAAADVAYGAWKQKDMATVRWITRADELSRDMVEHDDANPELRLYVVRRVLDVRVAIGGRWDTSDWTARVLQEAKQQIAAAEDPLRRQQLEWELGQALFDVAVMTPSSLYSDRSLADCDEVRQYLDRGGKHRQQTAEDAYLIGRVYAHVGGLYAMYKLDHAAAVTWFDKAEPLLNRPLPAAATGNLGRHAETFVSMGISYWQTGRRDDGLRLTELGVDLLKQAVASKLIDKSELAIPYGNLASMNRELGHDDQARSFADLASRMDTPKRR